MDGDPGGFGALAAAALADAEAAWSIGTFGAIGEFMRAPDEPVRLRPGEAATGRGAIRVEEHPQARVVAWERPTSPGAWTHGIAVCLPRDDAAMNRRHTITALGPDREALRDEDRETALFDLGLAAHQVDVCVRTTDADALKLLRSLVGCPALEGTALREIAASHPHRVLRSRLGRVEVYQPIPPADGATPEGPHTHVLPDLLRQGRTHAATLPIPAGWVPCLEIHPPHPRQDALGRPIDFDVSRHKAFQALLGRYGDARVLAAKRAVAAQVHAGSSPRDDASFDRHQRLARRVVLRQLPHTGAPADTLAAWRDLFDVE
jgi:hypothetical protein